jgi:hypothetical protein
MSILSSCFEIGQNEGTNEVLLNGSVLKGVVSQGRLSLENKDHKIIWRGTSDDHGEFNSAFLPSKKHLFTLTAKSVLGGFIQCDANECEVPTSPSKIYTFGQLIPGDEIGDITFRSALYLDDNNENEIERRVDRQVNGFSSLIIDFIDNKFEQAESREYFDELAQTGSHVLLSSLGLVVEPDMNILDITLPDITKAQALENESPLIVVLALLNASMSMNLSFLVNFSDALVRYSSSMDDELIQQELYSYQQALLSEAIALIVNGKVVVNNDQVLMDLQLAKDVGVDVNELNKRINNYLVVVGELPSEFTASSTNWNANSLNETGHWWWVSEFNRNEAQWLQLDYAKPFIATQVELGLSNAYPITDAKIQGSNDGTTWHDLADVNELSDTSSAVPPIEQISLSLNSGNAYRYYRFLAQPTNEIWLEHFCMRELASATNIPCEESKLPINAHASSYKFSAENVNNNIPESWWISEIASGKDEWLQISYKKLFFAKQVSLVVKQKNQGVAPEIQGSSDGMNWQTITLIREDSYPNETVDADGFRHISLNLNTNQSYRYFRYISKSSSFIWLSQWRLN